jgi:hypothetical protein
MLPNDCDVPPSVCCTSLYSIAEHILINVNAVLLDCLKASDCEPLHAYVTMGEGDDAVPNALTVEFDLAAPTPGSNRNNTQVPFIISRATFTVRLRESGWPTVKTRDNRIIIPKPETQNRAAKHAFAHGELMYRQLLYMQHSGTLIPATVKGCTNTVIGSLNPMRPEGGIIGFFAQVSTDLAWGAG